MKDLEVIWLGGADADMLACYSRYGDWIYDERVHEAITQLRSMQKLPLCILVAIEDWS